MDPDEEIRRAVGELRASRADSEKWSFILGWTMALARMIETEGIDPARVFGDSEGSMVAAATEAYNEYMASRQ